MCVCVCVGGGGVNKREGSRGLLPAKDALFHARMRRLPIPNQTPRRPQSILSIKIAAGSNAYV